MNSLQSAGDVSVDLSRGPSLSGDPPGLRLGLDDGVRGSLYRDLREEDDRNKNIHLAFYTTCQIYMPHREILHLIIKSIYF